MQAGPTCSHRDPSREAGQGFVEEVRLRNKEPKEGRVGKGCGKSGKVWDGEGEDKKKWRGRKAIKLSQEGMNQGDLEGQAEARQLTSAITPMHPTMAAALA